MTKYGCSIPLVHVIIALTFNNNDGGKISKPLLDLVQSRLGYECDSMENMRRDENTMKETYHVCRHVILCY